MSRFGTRAGDTRGAATLSPFFFDCLHLDGSDLVGLPARERFATLASRLPAQLVVPRVETDDPDALASYLSGTAADTDTAETVTVRYEGPTRVVLEARLRRPGIIVLADIFDPGWRLVIDGTPAPVLRANLLMRGAALTAGTHSLVYTYEPASVRVGGWVSGGGLLALIGLAWWAFSRTIPLSTPEWDRC